MLTAEQCALIKISISWRSGNAFTTGSSGLRMCLSLRCVPPHALMLCHPAAAAAILSNACICSAVHVGLPATPAYLVLLCVQAASAFLFAFDAHELSLKDVIESDRCVASAPVAAQDQQ